jgi:hypothetical protein
MIFYVLDFHVRLFPLLENEGDLKKLEELYFLMLQEL